MNVFLVRPFGKKLVSVKDKQGNLTKLNYDNS